MRYRELIEWNDVRWRNGMVLETKKAFIHSSRHSSPSLVSFLSVMNRGFLENTKIE